MIRRIHFDYTPVPLSCPVGQVVRYHPIIGRAADDGEDHTVTHIGTAEENHRFGTQVAWITGKSGCVDMASLSPIKKESPV